MHVKVGMMKRWKARKIELSGGQLTSYKFTGGVTLAASRLQNVLTLSLP
jgi:hypothetical protein